MQVHSLSANFRKDDGALEAFLLGLKMYERKKAKLVRGMGVNDADYKIAIIGADGRKVPCKIYRAWAGMLDRCYSSSYQSSQPTYIGCTVDSEWLLFSNFRLWALAQKWQGMELDKDILSPGNKIYSKDLCVFIEPKLNMFITDHGRARGDWPIGVCLSSASNKFISRISNPFLARSEHLGYFDCPQLAHEAWRKKKHEYALAYAAIQEDPRVAAALRIRYLPENLHKIGI